MKSRNLNFLEPSGPIQARNGTTLRYITRLASNKIHRVEGRAKALSALLYVGV